MRNIPLWLFLAFQLTAFGQSSCPYYSKYIEKGDAELKKGSKANFESAIDAYSTAMLHCPDKAEEARGKILEVFKAIENLKKEAEKSNNVANAQAKIAEIEKERAEKLLRAARNLALAAETNEYDPTMSLNIIRYNLLRHPEDESSRNNYTRLAKYAQNMSCQKVFANKDNYGKIISVAISDDGNKCLLKYAHSTVLEDLSTDHSISIPHTNFNFPVEMSSDGKKYLYAVNNKSVELYDIQNQKKYDLSSIRALQEPNAIVEEYEGLNTYRRNIFLVQKSADKVIPRYEFQETISAYKISKDGKFCVLGTEEGALYKWNALDSTLFKYPGQHWMAITSISISSDGLYILTGSADKIARLWSNKSDRTIQVFLGHTDEITAVALSPDGKFCLTAGKDFTFRLWDAYSGKVKTVFSGTHEKVVTYMAFTPDGSKFLTGNFQEPVRIWELKTGRPLGAFPEIKVPFALSDSSILTGSEDSRCRIWKFREALSHPTLTSDISKIHCLQFLNNGRCCLIGNEYTNIALWNVVKNNVVWLNKWNNAPIVSIGLSSDGTNFWSAYADNTIIFKNLFYQEREAEYYYDQRSFNQPAVKIQIRGDSVLESTVLKLAIPNHAGKIKNGKLTRDGRYFLCPVDNGDLFLWEINHDSMMQIISLRKTVDGYVVANEKTRKIYLKIEDDKNIAENATSIEAEEDVFDLLDEVVVERTEQRFQNLMTSHYGIAANTENEEKSSAISNLANGFEVSDDGSRILVIEQDSLAHLWDVKNRKHTFAAHKGRISKVALSRDGGMCMTGGEDQYIKIWDCETGNLKCTLTGHTGTITALAFSPDQKTCISGSSDQTARVWDTSSGELLFTFTGHFAPIEYVSILEDGAHCLTGTQDGSLQVWRIKTDCAECSGYRLSLRALWEQGINLEPSDLQKINKSKNRFE